MTHEDYMREALALAQEAYDAGEVPVGCVIVKDGRIIGRGRNRREGNNDPLAHAELDAIADACKTVGDWRLTGTQMYVTLEPCPMCAGAMVMSRVGRCVFGAADPEKGCCGSIYDLPADPALHSTTEWEQDPDTERYAELLSGSFRQKRKTGTERSPE